MSIVLPDHCSQTDRRCILRRTAMASKGRAPIRVSLSAPCGEQTPGGCQPTLRDITIARAAELGWDRPR